MTVRNKGEKHLFLSPGPPSGAPPRSSARRTRRPSPFLSGELARAEERDEAGKRGRTKRKRERKKRSRLCKPLSFFFFFFASEKTDGNTLLSSRCTLLSSFFVLRNRKARVVAASRFQFRPRGLDAPVRVCSKPRSAAADAAGAAAAGGAPPEAEA